MKHKNLRETRSLLLILISAIVVVCLLFVALFELDVLPVGLLSVGHESAEFVLTAFMELLTVALIPLSLKLLNLGCVAKDLQNRHEGALAKWGSMRLLMLGGLLLANLLLYYLFMNTSFGYMAIIVALCLPFVFPSAARCLREAFLTDDANDATSVQN